MKKFTVLWQERAETELVHILENAADRNRIAEDANAIDQMLAESGDQVANLVTSPSELSFTACWLLTIEFRLKVAVSWCRRFGSLGEMRLKRNLNIDVPILSRFAEHLQHIVVQRAVGFRPFR